MDSLYIETSIVSYLRQNPGAAGKSVQRQSKTRLWWNRYRERYRLLTTQYALDEAAKGNQSLAEERLRHLAGIPLLPLGGEIDGLAAEIVARAILPSEAIIDALHIASAAVNRIDFLLTWNCSHIANPMILPRVFRTLDDFGLPFPVICTPEDLLNEYSNE